jgi:kinesin family protein 2/24
VVRWWLRATAAAAAALNSAGPAGPGGDVHQLLSGADWPAETKLGLSFEHALGPGDEAAPAISKISASSPLARHDSLAPGARLVGCVCKVGGQETVRATDADGRTALLAALKAGSLALCRAADAPEPAGASCAADQVELSLRFAPPAFCRAAPPRVPRTFSGMSRLDVGKGADLLSAFAEPARGLKKWTEACDGDGALAAALYSELRGMADPFGGTPEERLEADRVKRAAAAATEVKA